MVDYNKKYKDIILGSFEIYIIWAVPFILLVRKQDHEIFTITIEDIKKILKLKQYINS